MNRGRKIILGSSVLFICLCVGACNDDPKEHTQTRSSGLKDAPALPPADFKQTMKEAKTYASHGDDEGVLMELDSLSPSDRERIEVGSLYKKASQNKALKQRLEYVKTYERSLLENGMDATVRASGKDKDTLVITFVLTNRPLVYKMQNDDDLNAQWKSMGFRTVRMSDGFDSSWSFATR